MNARPTTRATCLLLMAALVHQLGASPCGCLEHNGWCQSVVMVFGSSPSHERTAGVEVVGEAECEHSPPMAALVPTRPSSLEPADGFSGLSATPAKAGLLFGGVNPVADTPQSVAGLAPPVRAQTQVFRL